MPADDKGPAPTAEDRQMSGIGLFAGRGDVILSMGLALLFGCWAGWQLRGLWARFRKERAK